MAAMVTGEEEAGEDGEFFSAVRWRSRLGYMGWKDPGSREGDHEILRGWPYETNPR